VMARVVVAMAFGGPDVLTVAEHAVPAPGPGEVTVEVRGCGVNPVDYKVYSGLMGAGPAALPMRLGMEIAGVVTAVGPDVTSPAGAGADPVGPDAPLAPGD